VGSLGVGVAFGQPLDSLTVLLCRVSVVGKAKDWKNVWILSVCCMISHWRVRRLTG